MTEEFPMSKDVAACPSYRTCSRSWPEGPVTETGATDLAVAYSGLKGKVASVKKPP